MQKQLTNTGGRPVTLDLSAALSIAPSGGGTELVYPFPLGRVRVTESYEDVLVMMDRDAGAFGRAVDGLRLETEEPFPEIG